jgi:adenosine deaminase
MSNASLSDDAGPLARDLALLPKGHLHVHLEGAMRPATLAELANRYGMPVPTVRSFGSFTAFADLYVAACDVLQTWDDLRRVVREVVEDAAAEGALWIEPGMYAPHHRDRLGPPGEVLDVVLDEGRTTAARLGIGFGLMVAADRTRDPADAIAQARLAVERIDAGVVSFGLVNDEATFPPEPFVNSFRIAREAGLLSTPHAGELAGPAGIIGALDTLGAQRIQHGVRSVEDPELVRRLAAEGIALDVCPTSNLLLSVVPSIEQHPLRTLLAAGVRCSINADDPLLFGPGLLEEFELARGALGLTDQELASCARTSLVASGAPLELIATGVAGIDQWLLDGES